MVKMTLASSDSQASSVSSIASSRMQGYQSTMTALSSFASDTTLTGKAYASAKSYATSTLIPLLQAAILYEEDLSEAVGKIPSGYRSTEHLGGEDLDSDLLEEELASLDSSITSLNSAILAVQEESTTLPTSSNNIGMMYGQVTSLNTRRTKVMNQLAALSGYDTTSASYFDGLSDISSQLSNGISTVTSAMTNFNGSFPSVSSGDMTWASEVKSRWNKRQAALAAMEQDGELSEEDMEAIAAYVSINGSGTKEFLLYDNYYGYAKYKVSIKTNSKGNPSLTYTKDGLGNVKVGNTTITKNGVSTSTTQGTVIGGWSITSTFGANKDGTLAPFGMSLGNENTSFDSSIKVVNGQLAKVNTMTTKGKASAITASLAYEQGYYIRNNNTPTGQTVNVKGFDWGDVKQAGSYVVGGIVLIAGTAAAIYLAIQTLGTGSGVSYSIMAGSALLAAAIIDGSDDDSNGSS